MLLVYIRKGVTFDEEIDQKFRENQFHESAMTPETVQIKVSECSGWPFPSVCKWEATLADWDLGVPFGRGDTIQDAIEEFLFTLPEGTKFKWS